MWIRIKSYHHNLLVLWIPHPPQLSNKVWPQRLNLVTGKLTNRHINSRNTRATFPKGFKTLMKKGYTKSCRYSSILHKETQPWSHNIVKSVWTRQRSNRLKRLGTTACQVHGATHQEGWKGLQRCPRILGKRMEKSGATGTTALGFNTSNEKDKFDK